MTGIHVAALSHREILALVVGTIMATASLRAQVDTIQTTVPHLKTVFANDFRIGCLLSYRNIGFATDSAVTGQSAVVTPYGGSLIQYHMNNMSPGNNMKPQYTVDTAGSASAYNAASSSAKDSVDTHPIIRFNGDMIAQLNWAKKQGFTFRGHTLVWYSQTPTSFFRSGYSPTGTRLTKDKMIQRMDFYIHEIIRLIHQNWPGMLVAIDVVNEAVDDNTGSVRTTGNEWYTTFGDSTYIMTAFQLARQYTTQFGESQIMLYYNDYNTETSKKADGIVNLLTPIYQAGYLDGIGMQEHNNLSTPTAQSFIASYNKFYPVCTEMSVTELDVATGFSSPSAAVLAAQANQYGMLFKCFVERSLRSGRGKIVSVSKDGLNDAYTFQANQSSSLWDSHNQCKPAFYAAADVGTVYNALASLIAHADSLQQNSYTPSSWAALTAALATAVAARDQNYSVSVSADTGLTRAWDSLQVAVNGLVPQSNAVRPESGLPSTFALNQNYPNPFNPTTVISFELPVSSDVRLRIYDLLGSDVATLANGSFPAGTHQVTWNAGSNPSGVYFYRLDAGNFSSVRKLVLMK
ncbi:MAG TPA: endo-1,4-beta-xylanase [Bacteroidota bacterium]|nr:endo-1,4-beta-xylanase [Bacteroidota bacterium]